VVLICVAAALIVWLLPRRWLEGRLLDWLDAGGPLPAYASFGAAKGLAFGVAPIPAIGMGVLTRAWAASSATCWRASRRS
jgi:uncharacterized membrane protein YeiH